MADLKSGVGMRVSLAVLCDYANVTREGKLNIMGIFDTIFAANFPARHTAMNLVVRLVADPPEFGKTQTVSIQLMDEDGKKMFEAEAEMVPQGQGPSPANVDQILGLGNLVFPKPGNYCFSIVINGTHIREHDVSLKLVKIEPRPVES